MRMLERAGLVPTLRFPTGPADPTRAGGRPAAGSGRPVSRHLLVTNDFPPKVGGIQSYLWELWRRLDPERSSSSRRRRTPGRPPSTPRRPSWGCGSSGSRTGSSSSRRPAAVAGSVRRWPPRSGARSGACSTRPCRSGCSARGSGLPYAVVLHGAEVTVPGRLPGSRQALAHVLGRRRAGRLGRRLSRPPRRPGPPAAGCPGGRGAPRGRLRSGSCRSRRRRRAAARRRSGLPADGPAGGERQPPRAPQGHGRARSRRPPGWPRPSRPDRGHRRAGRDEADRLAAPGPARRARRSGCSARCPTTTWPTLVGAADVFVMACRNRWGGLEQEGFGIVFLEAAAAGVPQVAGRQRGRRRGGRSTASTGSWWSRPDDPGAVAAALRRLLADPALRRRDGRGGPAAGRRHPSTTTCSPLGWPARCGRGRLTPGHRLGRGARPGRSTGRGGRWRNRPRST